MGKILIKDQDTSSLIDRLGLERPRAKPLIVTLYGDSLLPLGGYCWLGDLIALVSLFGINERMTRTASFRLVRDGILEGQRIGRRSRYTLTKMGRRQFDSAQARIYSIDSPEYDGRWTLIALCEKMTAVQREALSRDLSWQGFAKLSNGLLGAARHDAHEIVRAAALDHAVLDEVTVFIGEPYDLHSARRLVSRAWPLHEIADAYQVFLKKFAPLADVADSLTAARAFLVQTLLIHSYRRILLRDPTLPLELLEQGWPGHKARILTRDIYLTLEPKSRAYVSDIMKDGISPEGVTPRYL